MIDECIGIAKSYVTRVGKGPFPTELLDETGELIRQRGNEFGVTTGRARRCGWFDAVIMRYSVRTSSLTSFVLNKLDPLTGIDKIKVCVAYQKGNEIITDFPASLEELEQCEPVYEVLDGWTEDITGTKSFSELPVNAQRYVKRIEELCECPICMVGVGPDRDDVISMF